MSVYVSYIASSGFSSLGGPINSNVGIIISVSRGTDQLLVVNVAPSTVASALSPGSFLFPFLILVLSLFLPLLPLGFLLCLLCLFFPLLLLCPLPSVSSLASSSFSSCFPSSPSPLPPTPAFPSPPPSPESSFPAGSSLSASAAVRPPPGFASLPPPPPGFAPLTPSLSPPPFSSSAFLSASAASSFSSSLPPRGVSSSTGQAPPVLSSSSSSSFSSSPPLDFASYQASMLGLSQDYQSLARWYFLSGGSDFRAYLSAFYPHLSSDASRDFSSGSSVFFSALRTVAFSVPLPAVSSAVPPLPSLAPVSSSRPPAPLPLAPPVSAPSVVAGPSFPLPPVSQLGGGLYALGSAQVLAPAPSGGAPLSASSALLSVPPSAVPSSSLSFSRPQGVSVLSPHSSSLLPSAPVAWPVSAAPPLGSSLLVSVVPRLPSVFLPTLFHPGSAAGPPVLSVASAPPPFCCASLGFAAGPSGFASSSADCMFGFTGSAPQPGPSATFPPLSGPSAAPSAPPLSDFDYGPEDPFAPGFGDHDASGAAAPDPPPLSDSA